jgi:hypothetical protein
MANKLELEAIKQRDFLIPKNTYNNEQNQQYSSGHKNALSDGDNKGKGTGVFMDIFNGGSDMDINGNPNYVGSGRIKNLSINVYSQGNGYKHPDTSGNVGQVII